MADGADAASPWVLTEGRRRSHAALAAHARRGAAGFAATGVGEGSAVALLLGNGFVFIEAQMAAAFAGAHPVPINVAALPETIGFILRDCGATALVAEAGRLEPLRSVLPAGLHIVLAEDWDGWAERHAPIAVRAAVPRGATIYTSGSTGLPKGVRRHPPPPGSRPTRALQVYGFDKPGRAVALIDGPLFHSVPNAYVRLALAAGADIVLRPGFDPAATLDAIARHRITHLHIVPSAMARLLALPAEVRARADVTSLRHVVHGAAPCPTHLKRAFIEWVGPIVHEYYGSTETGLVAVHDSVEARLKPGTVGRALPGIEIRILDPDGRRLPPGEVGEVFAGSDTLHDFTYLGQPERRAAIGRGRFVTAGDLGWLDADGYLYLCDRKRDAIRVGGTAVYPAAVEAALMALPGVADCAAFGVPEASGEAVVACVEPLSGHMLAPDALARSLDAVLTPAERPRRIVIVDRIPREGSGKVFKDRLRALFGASRAGTAGP